MAKIDLKLLDCLNDKDYIQAKVHNETNSIIITSYDDIIKQEIEIYLDKSTAIRFAKTVRTEINKLQ